MTGRGACKRERITVLRVSVNCLWRPRARRQRNTNHAHSVIGPGSARQPKQAGGPYGGAADDDDGSATLPVRLANARSAA